MVALEKEHELYESRRKHRVLVAFVLLIAAGLAACGTSGGTSTAVVANSAQRAAVNEAKATVASLEKAQPPIEVPKLTKPVPANVRLAVLTCVVPVCQSTTDPAVAAAKKLGWSVYQTAVQVTSSSYIAGWNAVLQQNPTAIAYVAEFPSDVVASQIAQARSRHIQLVAMTYNAPSLAASGASYAVDGVPDLYRSGQLMGDVVAADAGGPTQALFVWDPSLSNTLTPVKNGFASTATPAGVQVATLNVSIQGVGQSVPGAIVSYLQSHPDVKYLVMSLADFTAGVPEALHAVGLDKSVKIVSRAPQGGDLAQIKSGEQFASVAEEVAAAGYRAVDDVIRLVSGGEPVDPNPVGWHQIMVSSNITETTGPQPTPGAPDAFYAAWGAS
jgi:ribose transport system substrate-binding protein